MRETTGFIVSDGYDGLIDHGAVDAIRDTDGLITGYGNGISSVAGSAANKMEPASVADEHRAFWNKWAEGIPARTLYGERGSM